MVTATVFHRYRTVFEMHSDSAVKTGKKYYYFPDKVQIVIAF